MHITTKNIDTLNKKKNELMKKFDDAFIKNYEWLYDNDEKIDNYQELLHMFDSLLHDPEWKAIIQAYVQYRGDYISSDREAMAFIMALNENI